VEGGAEAEKERDVEGGKRKQSNRDKEGKHEVRQKKHTYVFFQPL
jgi:hypothetical protein